MSSLSYFRTPPATPRDGTSAKNKIGLSLAQRPEVFTPDREHTMCSQSSGQGSAINSACSTTPRKMFQSARPGDGKPCPEVRDSFVEEGNQLLEGLRRTQEEQIAEQEYLVARFLDSLGMLNKFGRDAQNGQACSSDTCRLGDPVPRRYHTIASLDVCLPGDTSYQAEGALRTPRSTLEQSVRSGDGNDGAENFGIADEAQRVKWPQRPSCAELKGQSVGAKFHEPSVPQIPHGETFVHDDEILSHIGVVHDSALHPAVSMWTSAIYWWNSLCEPARTGLLAQIVTHMLFEYLCFIVIFANGALIVTKTNDFDGELTEEVALAELCFTVYFCVELALRICVHRLYFFCNKDMAFNIFDTLVVVICVFERTLAGVSNKSYLRLVRIFKMVRVLRAVRGLRYFAPLRLALDMLLLSIFALTRCVVLLTFILCSFGIFFTQAAHDRIDGLGLAPDDDLRVGLQENFGSVWTSMVSLFQAVSGGTDWNVQYDIFRRCGAEETSLAYLFFILFFTVAFWNIVTGLFMQETLMVAQPDMDEFMFEKRKQEIKDARALMKLIGHVRRKGEIPSMDGKTNGQLSKEEFHKLMYDRRFRTYLESIGIDIKDTEDFFNMLSGSDDDKTAMMDLGLFVSGCLRMKGEATSVDLHSMDFNLRRLHYQQHQAWNYCSELLEMLLLQQQRLQQRDRQSKQQHRHPPQKQLKGHECSNMWARGQQAPATNFLKPGTPTRTRITAPAFPMPVLSTGSFPRHPVDANDTWSRQLPEAEMDAFQGLRAVTSSPATYTRREVLV